MGLLKKFQNDLIRVELNLPKRIDDKVNEIPEIVLKDTRVILPTREEKFTIGALMLAHNVDDYRRSKSAITLLPKVEIEFEKLIMEREQLIKENIKLMSNLKDM